MSSMFSEKRGVLYPNAANNKMFCDENGHELSGDDFIRRSCKVIERFEKAGKAVPVTDRAFIAWMKQAGDMLSKGESSDKIFENTLIRR